MLSRPSALSLLARLQQGLSHAELVHVPHPLWPLPPRDSLTARTQPLRISVLDASFNPPTLAHLALVNTHRPKEDYDAKLLLLSVRNADKTLKPTDATYVQRLEMMHRLAQHVHPSTSANVAIGIINEPTFVGKSTRLLEYLHTHLKSITSQREDTFHLELSFILGLDTLERLVSPRYYPSETEMLIALRRFLSPAEENSIIVCARRNQPTTSSSTPSSEAGEADDKLAPAREFIDSGRVVMIDIGDEESTYSSTAVRNAINEFGLGQRGRNIWEKYVEGSVADYIVHEGLYIG